jgi:hypothetical protein
MAAKTAFVLEGFNIRISEDWVMETVSQAFNEDPSRPMVRVNIWG